MECSFLPHFLLVDFFAVDLPAVFSLLVFLDAPDFELLPALLAEGFVSFFADFLAGSFFAGFDFAFASTASVSAAGSSAFGLRLIFAGGNGFQFLKRSPRQQTVGGFHGNGFRHTLLSLLAAFESC